MDKATECICDVWIAKLWRVERGTFHDEAYSHMEMRVKFTCPEHGEIELDNRENPTPHIDARDPVRSQVAYQMASDKAERDAEDKRKKRKWPHVDMRPRCP